MRFQILFFSLMLILFPFAVLASSDHDHDHNHDHGHDHSTHSHEPVSQKQAEEAAAKSLAKLVSKRKVAESWKDAKLANAEKKKFGAKTEWVVSFSNDKMSNDNKKMLYIFLSLNGDYVAANYTGK